ncbi:ABC transporter substrate-binding protein [Roseateles sp.]|uniref:substrate-binding periplasmic protein n=1 Tax=Roseateles sp. TaxID=1971397 RepID=UPI0026010CFF|nr:transporter substrate-binding domain-containing protein [Roseateles sp.]MBV8034160.1 transporter substrate-binding domain-containing protein [Roseateles sp.]
MRALLGALLLAVASLPALAAPCPKTLRIGFGDVPLPPMLLGNGTGFEDPPGWAVQVARDTLRRLGCQAEMVRLPGRRLLRGLESGELDFALFFSPTAERLRSMRFPVDAADRADAAWAPVLGHLALYGLTGSPALKSWDGRTPAAGVRVGVVAGSAQEVLARDRRWAVEPASSYETSVLALRARRFELLLSPRESLPAAQLSGEDALVELAPLVERLPYFAPASRTVQAQHPGFVTDFWRELCHATRRRAPEARGQDCGSRPSH